MSPVRVFKDDRMVEFKTLGKYISEEKPKNIISLKEWETSLKKFITPMVYKCDESNPNIQAILSYAKDNNTCILEKIPNRNNLSEESYFSFNKEWLDEVSFPTLMNIITILTK